MPIQAISYKKFTPISSSGSDLDQGRLDNSDRVWGSELIHHENVARARLLINEMCRFFCEIKQPMSFLAKDDDEIFFLLTEETTNLFSKQSFAEKNLINCFVNIFVETKDVISQIQNLYETSSQDSFELTVHLNRILFKIMLTPPVIMSHFVSNCLLVSDQAKTIKILSNRTEELEKWLMSNHSYQGFLLSDYANEEVISCMSAIRYFKIHNEFTLVDAFSPELIRSLYNLQWQLISKPVEERFSLQYREESPVSVFRTMTPSPAPRSGLFKTTGYSLLDEDEPDFKEKMSLK